MPVESISAASLLQADSVTPQPERVPPAFIDFIRNEVAVVNENVVAAEQAVQQLALGEAENLHQVMLAMNKAKTSFELVMQVRNKLLEGYQEIMRMQV